MSRRRTPPPRLIDLHVPWMLQYVGETTQSDPADYPPIAPRLGSTSGYLNAVTAGFVPARRSAGDWARQADPWAALGLTIARIEAEFSGRILADRDDFDRWRTDPGDLTWAVLEIEGFEALIRQPGDLDRIPGLVRRGARVFRPIDRSGGLLGGSVEEGDRGLEPLGRDFLNLLIGANPGVGAVAIDLAPMSSPSRRDVLDWIGADGTRSERIVPILSRTAFPTEPLGLEELGRIRALGGWIGLSVGSAYHETSDSLRESLERTAEVPFRGEPGPLGIGIATEILGRDGVAPGLETAEAIVRWLLSTFDHERATAWIHGNGTAMIGRLCGATAEPS